MLPDLSPADHALLVNQEVAHYRNILADSLPSTEPPSIPCVSADEQATELNQLAQTLTHERFYFVANYKAGGLFEHVNGVADNLGFTNDTFQVADYFSSIHPGALPSLRQMAQIALRVTAAANFPLAFVQNKLVVQLPIRRSTGEWWLCRRTLSPWQFDNQRRIWAVLNEYVFVKPFDGEALSPYVIAANGMRSEALEQVLRTQNFEYLLENAQTRPFTVSELRIARKLSYQHTLSVRELSIAFKTSERTMETHLRNIRKKASEHFQQSFPTSLEAVRYIRAQALV